MFNEITIIGNLGRSPELRYTAQGTAVCDFSLASNERRKNNAGETQDETTWFKVVLWGDQAERAAKYLNKGDLVFVKGQLRAKEWQDQEGRNRTTLEVSCKDMRSLTPHSSESEPEAEAEVSTAIAKETEKAEEPKVKVVPKQARVKVIAKEQTN